MRFGRKAVTVRNRDEFERALATADEIVVEGDDDLRAYAEHVVSQKDNNDIGPEDSTIIVEHLSGDARFMWTELGEKSSAQHWLLGPPRPESRAAPTRIRFGLALAAAAALAVAILGAGWFFSVRIGPFPNAGP